MTKSFEIKGWHVLTGLLGIFGVVIAVNTAYVVIAISSFPGEDAPKAYAQGLHYNDAIAARAAQNALGWRATTEARRHDDGLTEIDLTIRDSNFAPIGGLAIEAVLRRPAEDASDRALTFRETANGYTASAGSLARGQWDLRVTARDAEGHEFQAEKRLWLP
jgi:nitrogen fixation protein FixH